ncbi:MAG: carboxypeptidase regulatory-like domain-containing protein, partial [Acidobacteriota bacterium]
MVDQFRRLGLAAKIGIIFVSLAVLAGSLYGGRLLLLQPSQTPALPSGALKGGPPQSVSITRADWTPAWLAPPAVSTFTGEVVARAGHGMFVLHAQLRVTDGAGNLLRSWAEIKKVKTETGQETVLFTWSWDGTDGLGQPVGDGPYSWSFTVQFRGQTDTRSGVVGIDRLPPAVSIQEPEQGQVMGASVDVLATWTDALSGIDPSTGMVTLDGAQVSGLQIDASGARGTLEDVAGGPHTLVVYVADHAGNTASASGEFVTDRTAPAVTIREPRGQVNGPSVAVDVVWTDEGGAGIDSSSGLVLLDGSSTSGLTIDQAGARGTLEGVADGPHVLSASVSDQVGNEASASSDFEVATGQPGVQNTSILGTVADSTGQSLADVSVSSPGATHSVSSDHDGRFLIEMASGGTHWLTLYKDDYVLVQRPAQVAEGQHYNVGEVRLTAKDSRVTTIGPEGGTAANSTGDIEVVVPPGALAAPVDMRLTHIPSSKELPGPLNASDNVQSPINYTHCVVLDPPDTTFAIPATLRFANQWGFPAGFRLPSAFWDQDANKWVPDGADAFVSADGSVFTKEITAFHT